MRVPTTRQLAFMIFGAWVAILIGLAFSGCAVVSEDRVFPKFTWYWSADAKHQRSDNGGAK